METATRNFPELARPGRIGRYLTRLRDSVRERGARAAIAQLAESIRWRVDPACRAVDALRRENAAFDIEHGTDTGAEALLTQLGVPADDAGRGNGIYRGISRSRFRSALAPLGDAIEGATFIDYGSGKGKALMLAAELPFARIIGIEYAPALHAIARSNLARYPAARARGAALEARLGDARHLDLPAEPLVCFFFNPFDTAVWRDVLARLAAHFERHRQPIHLVYANIRDVAELGDVFDEFPVFASRVHQRNLRILSAIPREEHLS